MSERTRKLTIVAQDPGVRVGGRILTTEVTVPAERLAPGPRGHRESRIFGPAGPELLSKDSARSTRSRASRIVTEPPPRISAYLATGCAIDVR